VIRRHVASVGSISWRAAVRRAGIGVDFVRRIAAPDGQPPFTVAIDLSQPGERREPIVKRFDSSEDAGAFRRTVLMVRAARLFVAHRVRHVPGAMRVPLLDNIANHTERAVALGATNDELQTLARRLLREWRAEIGLVNGSEPDEADLPPLQPNGLMARPERLEP
jgi:hypothetical protein